MQLSHYFGANVKYLLLSSPVDIWAAIGWILLPDKVGGEKLFSSSVVCNSEMVITMTTFLFASLFVGFLSYASAFMVRHNYGHHMAFNPPHPRQNYVFANSSKFVGRLASRSRAVFDEAEVQTPGKEIYIILTYFQSYSPDRNCSVSDGDIAEVNVYLLNKCISDTSYGSSDKYMYTLSREYRSVVLSANYSACAGPDQFRSDVVFEDIFYPPSPDASLYEAFCDGYQLVTFSSKLNGAKVLPRNGLGYWRVYR